MAVKLNSPLVGTGIGGAASLATQGILRVALKKDLDAETAAKPLEGVKGALAHYPGAAGAVVSGASAAVLLLLKQKQAALGAGIGALIASALGIILDVQAAKARAAKALPAGDTTTTTTTTTGTTAGLRGLRVSSAFAPRNARLLGLGRVNPSKFGTPSAAI